MVREPGRASAAALAAELGLPEDERLELLELAPTTVTLARRGAGLGLPEEAPALHASLATLPLAFVLRAIHSSRQSGLLHVAYRGHRKSVWLHEGEVVFATSNQRVDRLGESLLRAGAIQLSMLRETERRYQLGETQGRFGSVLVELGFLTPRELWSGVKYQVEEIVRSLFAYGSGTVSFWEGEREPDNVVRLALETGRLVEEGLQRSEELDKFLAMLRDPRVCLARVEDCQAELAGNERALADAIGAGRSFEDVCRVLDFDAASAARSLQLLRLVGAVRLLRLSAAEAPDDTEAPAAAREALLARTTAQVKRVAELAAHVAEAEADGEGVRERLNRVLDDATGRYPALLTGIELGPGASLDAEVLVDRALHLPGPREEQLAGALGELLAYLEFEVKNHPGLEDPDAILERVRQLA